ncbi:hypothetical protein PT2222_140122 [Paraburkholderia tropica]
MKLSLFIIPNKLLQRFNNTLSLLYI